MSPTPVSEAMGCAGEVWDSCLVDDAETVEEDDDGEGCEDDADADAGTHAALSGSCGKAALLARV